MGNGLDYRTLVAELPDWVAPAYDGLEIASP
jgi:phosphoribosyl 1,2-cyclic phosphate phosphodiesterase